jgi:hypothetical protein
MGDLLLEERGEFRQVSPDLVVLFEDIHDSRSRPCRRTSSGNAATPMRRLADGDKLVTRPERSQAMRFARS